MNDMKMYECKATNEAHLRCGVTECARNGYRRELTDAREHVLSMYHACGRMCRDLLLRVFLAIVILLRFLYFCSTSRFSCFFHFFFSFSSLIHFLRCAMRFSHTCTHTQTRSAEDAQGEPYLYVYPLAHARSLSLSVLRIKIPPDFPP